MATAKSASVAAFLLAVTCAASPPDGEAQARKLSEYAERSYRLGDFAQARELFVAANTHVRAYIPAELGLARLDLLESYRKRASDRIECLALAHGSNPLVARAQRLMADMKQAREILRSPYQHYAMPLRIDQRGAQPEGVYITVSINGNRPLRLLVDTGASRLLLNSKSASNLNLETIEEGSISGYGKGLQAATVSRARSLKVGELELGDVLIHTSGKEFANGMDGLIGTRLFREFLVKMDIPGKRLELEPFAGQDDGSSWMDWNRDTSWLQRGFEPLYQLGHYLLVKATVEQRREGVFLLDTGASFNALAEEESEEILESGKLRLLAPANFRIGWNSIPDQEVRRLTLRWWTARNGVRLEGVLGFPTIRHGVLTLNYRDGYWRLSR